MAIADTSRGAMRYVEEVTIGTTPAAALTNVRFTGESLSQSKSTEVSNEIRSDRQITDLVDVDSEPAGDINFELSYDNLDDFIPAALMSAAWSTTVAVSETDISAVASDNSYNTAAGDFTAENIVVGQWIKVAGFTGSPSTNNGYAKVESITAAKMVVSGLTLVDDAAGETVTMTGSMVRNGTTKHGFTLEKEFADITQFISFVGMEVNTLSLEATSNAIVTGSLGFMGRTAAITQATVGTGAHIAAPTNDIINATSNMGSVRENGVELSSATFQATGISLSIENGLRSQKAIGVDGNVGIGNGRCTVTGTLDAYFVSETLIEKFLNNTETSLDYRLTDSAGNTYIITLPRVKYTSGSAEIGAIDTDVPMSMDFQALRDVTTDATVQIDKFVA